MSTGTEAELALSEPEGSTTVEVEFLCGIEEDVVFIDELKLADTDREETDPEALSNGPDELNTDVGTRPWVLLLSADCDRLLLLTCSVPVTIAEDGAIEATTLEPSLAEATVAVDALVSTARDEE